MSSDSDSDSEILAGRFQLLYRLGSGALCDVHAALDLEDGSRVALKRFRAPSRDGHTLLKAEFRTLVDHAIPGLVRFFDLVVRDDTAFFTMELVHGKTLTEYAASAALDDVCAVLRRVARALAEHHACPLLHRDL
jgi:serine/threonine protein kinase